LSTARRYVFSSFRIDGEAFNIFNHHNMFVNGSTVDVSQFDHVQGKKGGLGLRPERLDMIMSRATFLSGRSSSVPIWSAAIKAIFRWH